MMTSSSQTLDREIALRALTPRDLEAVVMIDAALSGGRGRRLYFERRLDAALKEPKRHVQFAAEYGGELVGYMLARKLAGEFGRAQPVLRLEVVGVRPMEQNHGVASRLLDRLAAYAVAHGITQIRTQSPWRNHSMLAFLDRSGFRLGRNYVLDAVVHDGRLEQVDPIASEHEAGAEVDYSAQSHNDFEALARDRAEVRSLAPDDLADIVRIDQHITGLDRSDYLQHVFSEALENSGVRVSLVGKHEGVLAGFVMARTDFGDFGRAEPVSVIDTIGVDPADAHHHIGLALMSQLFANLHALHVERVETLVAPQNLDLLHFFCRLGFVPAERLAFVKELAA